MIQRVVALRLPIVLGIAVVTAAAAWFIPRLEFDVSVESLLHRGDPDLLLLDEITTRFDSVAVPLVLAYRDPELFTPEGLRRLDQLTREVAVLPKVRTVDSLTTARVPLGTADGVEVASVAAPLPTTQEQAEVVRRLALSQRHLVGNLVNADGTVAAVIVTGGYERSTTHNYFPELVRAMRGVARRVLGDREHHFAGLAVFHEQMLEHVHRDQWVLTVVPVLLVVGLLALGMRSVIGVLLPLLVVVVSLAWTFGLMGALGLTLGVASLLLPPLIVVIGCADSVHVLHQVAQDLAAPAGRSRSQLVADAMKRVGLALLVTTSTTWAGFVSLAVSDIQTIRQFGIFASIAIVFVLFLNLTLAPAVLSWWPPPAERGEAHGGRLEAQLRRLDAMIRRRPIAVLVAWLLIIAAALSGLPRLRVETGFRDNFTADSPIARSLDFVQQHLTGSDLLTIYVKVPGEDGILTPEVLRHMDTVAEELRRQPGARRVESIVDLLSDVRHALDPTTPPGTYLPATQAEAAQLLLMLETGDDFLKLLLTPRRDGARILGRFDAIPTSTAARVVGAVQRRAAALATPGVETHISGPVYLTQRLVNEVVDSQVNSFALAVLSIFAMIALAVRSWTLGALAMVPNVLPVAFMLGAMGWLDIPLNDVTIMSASIALGIAVDDTIHYLVRYRIERRLGRDKLSAMATTQGSLGRSMITTSVVLSAGYASTMLASFKPPIFFGAMSALTILVALAAELTVTPALLFLLPDGATAGAVPHGVAPEQVEPEQP